MTGVYWPASFLAPEHTGAKEPTAWEDNMPNATEYRAMAAEEHRLAGMCRSPDSREEHRRRESELLALADKLEGKHAPQRPTGPNTIR
jgi:hypothetical protein